MSTWHPCAIGCDLAQTGDHGNVVHALMSDYESIGPLRLYRFQPAQRAVQVITYDTAKRALVERTTYVPEASEHQFTLRDVLCPANLGFVKGYADATIRDSRDTAVR